MEIQQETLKPFRYLTKDPSLAREWTEAAITLGLDYHVSVQDDYAIHFAFVPPGFKLTRTEGDLDAWDYIVEECDCNHPKFEVHDA